MPLLLRRKNLLLKPKVTKNSCHLNWIDPNARQIDGRFFWAKFRFRKKGKTNFRPPNQIPQILAAAKFKSNEGGEIQLGQITTVVQTTIVEHSLDID